MKIDKKKQQKKRRKKYEKNDKKNVDQYNKKCGKDRFNK